MPIIESVAADIPLSQGDLLQGISLYSTTSWKADGGQAAQVSKERLCLVISRRCAIAHKEQITVASVGRYSGGMPDDLKTLDKVLGFLKDIRDGVDAPDVFYLGEIPGLTGRYGARLDSLHTVRIGTDAAERQELIETSRIGRLASDFLSDLHVRIFRAVASFGFDDVRWLSDDDLEMVVRAAKCELGDAESKRRAQELHNSKQQFAGSGKKGQEEALAKALTDLTNDCEELASKLAPFAAEQERRAAEQAARTPAATASTSVPLVTTN